MDNLSQDVEENVLGNVVGSPDADDIQFEEAFDIDSIQKKLQQQIEDNNMGDKPSESTKDDSTQISVESEAESKIELAAPTVMPEATPVPNQKDEFEKKVLKAVSAFNKEADADAKKYVIYIDSNNINFMENLSSNERRELINKLLQEQDEISIKRRELAERRRFFVHAMLATVVFIMAFPLMFMLVNKALEATIANFETAKGNFAKLYKEQGKIKQSSMNAD